MPQENIINNKPDIDISEVVSVYYHKSSDWKRNKYAARGRDGLILFLEGEIDYFFEDKHYIAKAGDILCFPGNAPYSGKKLSKEDVAFVVVDFLCKSEDEYRKMCLPIVTETTDFEMYRNSFFDILRVYRENRLSSELHLKAMLYELIAKVYEDVNPECKRQSNSEILDFIGTNFGDCNLRISDICERYFISESQLRRNIIKLTGMTPNEYINVLRLDTARNELCYSERSVKEISRRCGFSSQYYFSKCFVRHFGMSPTVYRQKSESVGNTVKDAR